MKRAWIGVALLSTSWLFGLSYYHQAQWLLWAILVSAGTVLLIGVDIRRPIAIESTAAAVLLLPAVFLAPWPYRMALLLFFSGLVLGALPIPRRWPGILAPALILGGIILTVQSLGILGYEYVTARSHELPWPWPGLLYSISRLLGIRAGLAGTNLALYTPRSSHCLGATWELLLDPPTLAFLFGGIVMLCFWKSASQPSPIQTGKQLPRLRKHLAAFVILIVAWLPVRSAILISIFMHRALRTKYDEELVLINQFWNPWLLMALLLGPILLSLRFIHKPSGGQRSLISEPGVKRSKHLRAIALTIAGCFMLIMGMLLDAPGRRKEGRILVDEHKSTWEPTDKAFDTEWYGHDSGYNFYCIYDYISHFYEAGRLTTAIDDAALMNCDVLIVKVPTERYEQKEIAAIERFVERGGGLLLIGEHTNVYNTGTNINDIANVFGFSFRYDCLFGIDTVFTQLYNPPLVPHQIIQEMPPLDFAVSCSISPGLSRGRAAIRSTGLKNLLADYHASNFYPQVEDKAQMRYGAFVQLWTTHRAAGRVAAFTDSTIFSNFATFEPGKAELMLGMLEWLNHRNSPYPIRLFLFILGFPLLVYGLVLCRKWGVAWLVVICAAVFGWSIAAAGTRAIHRNSMRLPKAVRPMVQVAIDRTVCNGPLSKSGFISGKQKGFGIFERWILRLGYFTSRRSGPEALTGDLVVFMDPNQTVTNNFREELVDYVEKGGKVLILDSPANTGSTANSLLYPFGLTVTPNMQLRGQLKAPEKWPVIQIDSTCEIKGGQAIASVTNIPVIARAHHGKGAVTVVGFGNRFADAYMGVTGDVVPDDELRKVFDVQFAIFRDIISDPQ
ncbi:MAG: hypothetical protein GY845_07385 [Planctomycetes bacterium]|nr:hypothetical protein [Planctomycetota bacterium]